MPSAEAAAKLTPEVKAVVKATAPVLASVGAEITQAFYPLLFRTYPQVGGWVGRFGTYVVWGCVWERGGGWTGLD